MWVSLCPQPWEGLTELVHLPANGQGMEPGTFLREG